MSQSGLSRFALILVLMSFLFSFIPPASAASERAEDNTLSQEILQPESALAQVSGSITLNPPTSREARVAPDENGVAIFDGEVDVQIMGPGSSIQLIEITLDAQAEGLASPISPSSATLDPKTQTSLPFSVMVKVPEGTSCTEEYNLKVTGTAVTFPGMQSATLTPAEGKVQVDQYYKFTLGLSSYNLTLKEGDSESFDVRINNQGNGMDTFSIWFPEDEDLGKKGIQCLVNGGQVTISEKGTSGCAVTVSIDDDVDISKPMMIGINVESEQFRTIEGGINKQSICFRLKVDSSILPQEITENLSLIIFLIVLVAMIAFIHTRRRKKRRRR